MPDGRDDATLDLLVVGPAARDSGGVSRYLDEQRRRLPADIAVAVHDDGTGRPEWSLARTALVSLVAMLRVLTRRRPDVVHVHASHGLSFYRAGWYVLVAALLWRRPVVVHVHGSAFDEFVLSGGPAAVAAQRVVFGLADRVVVLSERWRSVLAERVPPRKLVVLPNAVDPSEYDPTYGADPPVVVLVANQIARKGIREFVTAVDRVLDDGTDVRVRIAGRGPLAHHSERLAAAHEDVDYLGYVDEAEKRRLVSEASLYALPTHAEGLPIGLLEGMAGGNAVLTTTVDAIPEVVDEESGWTVPPADADAVTDALRAFAADPGAAVEMGRHNRAIVEERYAWSVVVDDLVAVYRSLEDAPDPSTDHRESPPRRESGTGSGTGAGSPSPADTSG